MLLWFFLIFSTVCWGIAEIFYKKGNLANERYSHLKTTVFVGIFFGIYSVILFFSQGFYKDMAAFGLNFLKYLPIALCYLVSMACSYFGVRYIEESISDPIENSSCGWVALFSFIFVLEDREDFLSYSLGQKIGMIVSIIAVVGGVIAISVLDGVGKDGRARRAKNIGKKLAIIAFAMPFCYMALDAIGTFFDDYVQSEGVTYLVDYIGSETSLANIANCCYEFTFFLVAMGIWIFLAIKKEPLFSLGKGEKVKVALDNNNEILYDENGNAIETEPDQNYLEDNSKQNEKWYKKFFHGCYVQRNKILAALFEMGGQSTYILALDEGEGIAAVILGAGTVLISFILSRIILKEKLNKWQYVCLFIILAGIVACSLLGL